MSRHYLSDQFSIIRSRIDAGLTTPRGQFLTRWAQRLLFLGVIYIFVRQLTAVGWSDVLNNLPTSPLFYFFWALRYALTPAVETQTYGIIWKRPMVRHFWVFIRKRVYNNGVAGMSGEGFLSLWARRNLDLGLKDVLISIKDANILSALTANSVTILLVITALVFGLAEPLMRDIPNGDALVWIGLAVPSVMVTGAILFRKKILSLEPREVCVILTWHSARHALLIVLAIAMYASAVPGVPLLVWLSFIVLFMLLSRIPFLPNQDLVYAAAALAVTSSIGVADDVMAGVLLCEAALIQIANFGLFLGTSHLGSSRSEAETISS